MTAGPPPTAWLPERRRLYLMRHGAVDYYAGGALATSPGGVPLNAEGRVQAEAAGRLFAEAGVRFDRVLTSGLLRTVQTAEGVLAACGQALAIEHDERLQEIRPGPVASIAPDALHDAFLGVFSARGGNVLARRFLGGESVAELLERVLPPFEALLADPDWRCGLLVLHGGVNRALLSRVISGGPAFFAGIEQTPACVNVIDVGPGDLVLRGTNLAPQQWLQAEDRHTTMERLLAQYLQLQGG